MQSMYFETDRFIQHEGNLVDLTAYRQKLSAVSGDCWPAQDEGFPGPEVADEPALTILPERREPFRRTGGGRVRRVSRAALVLDLCATLAIVVLTAAAVAGFLLL